MSKALSCLAIAVLCLAGCQGADPSSKTYQGTFPIQVVCTTGMVADLVRNVGGEQVTVEQLLGADVDPHLYKATPGDMRKLAGADMVFFSGLHLEGKMTDVLKSLAGKLPCQGVADSLDAKDILSVGADVHDPHVWFDVSLWSRCADVVRAALVEFDPKHADDYTRRARAYRAELEGLHDYARNRIAEISESHRVLVTSHDAFRYFGRAYQIEVQGIQGISTETEASVKGINDLVRFIAERRVKAVFVETSVNQRNMQALLEGCQAAGHKVVLGGELFSDAMGQEGTPTGTYAGMIRHNVETIVQALR